jgi:hypothetical protein
MPMKKGFRALVDEAMAQVRTLSVDEARALLDDPTVQFVDVRDIRELEREGVIPHALHAPRGMLEFWVDPETRPSSSSVRPAGAARCPPRPCKTWAWSA